MTLAVVCALQPVDVDECEHQLSGGPPSTLDLVPQNDFAHSAPVGPSQLIKVGTAQLRLQLLTVVGCLLAVARRPRAIYGGTRSIRSSAGARGGGGTEPRLQLWNRGPEQFLHLLGFAILLLGSPVTLIGNPIALPGILITLPCLLVALGAALVSHQAGCLAGKRAVSTLGAGDLIGPLPQSVAR